MPENPLFRQTTTAVAENPYARLGYQWNPFPEKAGVIPDSEDPRSNGSIYVEPVRAVEQQRFEELLIGGVDKAVSQVEARTHAAAEFATSAIDRVAHEVGVRTGSAVERAASVPLLQPRPPRQRREP